jgi:hypothetical protein
MTTWPGGSRPGKSIQPQALEIDGLGEVPGPGKHSSLQIKQPLDVQQQASGVYLLVLVVASMEVLVHGSSCGDYDFKHKTCSFQLQIKIL